MHLRSSILVHKPDICSTRDGFQIIHNSVRKSATGMYLHKYSQFHIALHFSFIKKSIAHVLNITYKGNTSFCGNSFPTSTPA